MTMEAADARVAAAMLMEESTARRIDPITEVYTQLDEVHLTVVPTSAQVWDTWCHLFKIDPLEVTWGRSMATATGVWFGVTVRVRALDTDRWAWK